MDRATEKKLEGAGWRVGSADEFLGLSDEESAFVGMKLSLAKGLRLARKERGLTQVAFARLIQSSQSRVAKMEAGDPSVSLDLMVKALLVLGVGRGDIAELVGAVG